MKKFKIKCVGGENMTEEKTKLIFVETTSIPKMSKRTGRDWKKLVTQIPEGKSLVVPEDEYGASASVRSAIKKINEELKEKVYAVTQRTVGEITTVYITRL